MLKDIFDFIARSEWPIVVAGALLLFRRPLRELIGRVNLTKIDVWGFKAEFEKGLDKIEALTWTELTKAKPAIATDEKLQTDRLYPYSSSPAGATPETLVLDSWRELEGTMRQMIDKMHPRLPGPLHTPPLRFESAAEELGLSADDVASLLLMRKLRNDLAHSAGAQITWDDALRFQKAARRMLRKLQRPSADDGVKS
jgi:hypothetical protein